MFTHFFFFSAEMEGLQASNKLLLMFVVIILRTKL